MPIFHTRVAVKEAETFDALQKLKVISAAPMSLCVGSHVTVNAQTDIHSTSLDQSCSWPIHADIAVHIGSTVYYAIGNVLSSKNASFIDSKTCASNSQDPENSLPDADIASESNAKTLVADKGLKSIALPRPITRIVAADSTLVITTHSHLYSLSFNLEIISVQEVNVLNMSVCGNALLVNCTTSLALFSLPNFETLGSVALDVAVQVNDFLLDASSIVVQTSDCTHVIKRKAMEDGSAKWKHLMNDSIDIDDVLSNQPTLKSMALVDSHLAIVSGHELTFYNIQYGTAINTIYLKDQDVFGDREGTFELGSIENEDGWKLVIGFHTVKGPMFECVVATMDVKMAKPNLLSCIGKKKFSLLDAESSFEHLLAPLNSMDRSLPPKSMVETLEKIISTPLDFKNSFSSNICVMPPLTQKNKATIRWMQQHTGLATLDRFYMDIFLSPESTPTPESFMKEFHAYLAAKHSFLKAVGVATSGGISTLKLLGRAPAPSLPPSFAPALAKRLMGDLWVDDVIELLVRTGYFRSETIPEFMQLLLVNNFELASMALMQTTDLTIDDFMHFLNFVIDPKNAMALSRVTENKFKEETEIAMKIAALKSVKFINVIPEPNTISDRHYYLSLLFSRAMHLEILLPLSSVSNEGADKIIGWVSHMLGDGSFIFDSDIFSRYESALSALNLLLIAPSTSTLAQLAPIAKRVKEHATLMAGLKTLQGPIESILASEEKIDEKSEGRWGRMVRDANSGIGAYGVECLVVRH